MSGTSLRPVIVAVEALRREKRRVLARNGPERWEDFRTRWIPMENSYHRACSTAERADITINRVERG